MVADGSPEGFTFFEIVVVVLLIGLVASLALPSLDFGGQLKLRSAGREVAGELAYASQRAVATGHEHSWVVDLDEQAYRLEERVDPEEDAWELPTHEGLLSLAPPEPSLEYQPVNNRTGGWRRLSDPDVELAELCVSGDCFTDGLGWISFTGDGAATPAELWLIDRDGYRMLVRVMGFTGEIRVEEVFDD